MNENEIQELSGYLREINESLVKIFKFSARSTIKDIEFLEAILTIEEGFVKTLNFIAETKGYKKLPNIPTQENINEILKESSMSEEGYVKVKKSWLDEVLNRIEQLENGLMEIQEGLEKTVKILRGKEP